MIRRRTLIAVTALVPVLLVACGDDDDASTGTTASSDSSASTAAPATTAAGSTPTSGAAGDRRVAGRRRRAVPRRPLRRQQGRRHDHATCPASTSPRPPRSSTSWSPTHAGYYDDLCLDVELTAQLLDRQLPDRRRRRRPDRLGRLVQRGRRLRHRQRHRARGRRRRGTHGDRQPDRASPARPPTLEDLAGSTIGVKGKIPPSVAAMLAGAGLVEGTDYETVPIDGFDPVAQFAPGGHRRVPRLQEQRAGHARAGRHRVRPVRPDRVRHPRLVRRAVHDRTAFAEEHPTAVEDFMRATMKGLADAIADPGGGDRRPPSTSSRPTATRASCRSRARRSAGRPTRRR